MRTYSASELDVIRARPQGSKWYLAIHKPRQVAFYTLDTAPSYPLSSIDVTFLSGLSDLARQHYTVWVGSASGQRDLGIARITNLSLSASSLLISESGSGLINWEKPATTHITVVEQVLPWSKHPKFDTAASQWRMDGYTAFDANIQYSPYPNMDMSVVTVLPTGASGFTASFIGSSSIFWDNPYLANSWYFPDRSATNNLGTEAAPITHQFSGTSPNGSMVRLELFDSVGGSSMGHRVIWVFDDLSQVPRVAMAEIAGGIEQGGYSTQISVFNLNDTDLPIGTEIVIFEEPDYAGSKTSVGTNSILQKNIVFRGWTTKEVSTINPLTSTAIIEAETVNGIMNQISSYDIFMAKVPALTGASHWIESENLSLDRVAYQLLRWRSTISNICNFTPASGLAIADNIQFQSLGKGNLFDQLNSNYGDRGYLGFFASDMQSSLFAFEDGQITGASANIQQVMQLEPEDRMDTIQIERDYRPLNSQVQLYAVSSVTPVAAESPGNVMGYFGGTQEISQGLLVDTQDRLITWSGNLRAKQNAEFKRVTMPLSGNLKLDAVPQTRVAVSLSAVDNARGYTWTDKTFWLNSVKSTYTADAGYVTQEVELSEIVDGAGGSAITFPTVDDIIPAPTQLPSPTPTPTLDIPVFGTGFGTVYVMTGDTLGRTRSFGAVSPAWVDIAPADSGFNDYILDPYTPATTGYLISDTGVWKSTDLDLASPSFSLILDNATIVTALGAATVTALNKIIASINFQDFIAFIFSANDGVDNGIYCGRSEDGGDTWTFHLIKNTKTSQAGGFDYVPHAIGGQVRLYCGYTQSGVGKSIGQLTRSDNGGQTWSTPFTFSGNSGGAFISVKAVHCPYDGNTSGNLAYISSTDAWRGLYYTDDSGASTNQLQTTAHAGGRRNMETHPQNNQAGYRWIPTNDLTVSDDGFDNVSSVSMSGYSGNISGGGGFPTEENQFYAITTDAILVSTDRGVNWSNKTGDWAFGFTYQDDVGVIVPLWTE